MRGPCRSAISAFVVPFVTTARGACSPTPASLRCSTSFGPRRNRTTMSSAQATLPPTQVESEEPTVQYVVVRRDLLDIWPTGSVIAQAVHASLAAVWSTRTDAVTSTYCSQPGNGNASDANPQMHTVVLEAKNEDAVLKLAGRLSEAGVEHVMWREQPENFVTALAAKPYPRSTVKKHFSKFRLFK